jgi:hypothetical protein
VFHTAHGGLNEPIAEFQTTEWAHLCAKALNALDRAAIGYKGLLPNVTSNGEPVEPCLSGSSLSGSYIFKRGNVVIDLSGSSLSGSYIFKRGNVVIDLSTTKRISLLGRVLLSIALPVTVRFEDTWYADLVSSLSFAWERLMWGERGRVV